MHLKQIIASVLFLIFALPSYATNLDLRNMKINDVVRLVYTEILDQPYMTDSAFNNDNQVVSIYLKDKSNEQVKQDVIQLIESSGYDVEQKNNLTTIKQQTPDFEKTQQKPRVYIPRFRTVEQLRNLVKSAFPKQTNSSNRSSNKDGSFNANTNELTISTSTSRDAELNDFFIYQATDKQHETINAFLQIVDIPIDQIQITTASYEISETEDKVRAIDIIGEVFKQLSFSVITGGADNILKFTGGSLSAALKFFDSDTRFHSISKPHARIKSGATVKFQSGQDVPTLGAITQSNGVTTQSVEYRSTGVIMDIAALSLEDTIDLDINLEFSGFIPNRTSNINSPQINKQLIQTQLSLKSGEVVVIGGLESSSASLADEHALGLIRTSQIKDKKKFQTFVFLQASKI